MDALLRDLRYGVRILTRAPGFTLVAVVTLALGIGANTAIFSVIHGILLSPFPYPDSERVVSVWNRFGEETRATLAEPEFKAYRDRSQSFEAIAAIDIAEGNLTGRGEPRRVSATVATADIFPILGVTPERGRFFTEEEDVPGGEPIVVVSHELWRSLGGEPDLVGEKLILDGRPFTVIGVMPPGVRMPHDYQFGSETDLFLPLRLDPAVEGDWGMHGLVALARIREGLTIEQARRDIGRVVAQLKSEHAGSRDAIGYESFGVSLLDLRSEVVGDFSVALAVLLGSVTLVLLIACANVANLLLARAESRRREIALRTALGAARRRLLRQLLTESMILALLGGLAGVLVAHWLVAGIVVLDPGNIPRLAEVQLDKTVLVFSLLLTMATGLGFGLLPAWSGARAELREGLGSGGRTGGSVRARRLLQSITVAEVSLSVVLVVGAGLLMRSLWNMQAVDPGFRTDGLLTFEIELPGDVYRDARDVAAFNNRFNARLRALPGVTASGGVTGLPLASRRGDWNFYPEGYVVEEGVSSPRGDWQVVTPGYFETLGVPVLGGRTFTESDTPDSPVGIVFNRSLAERYYPGESPVGKRVRLGGNADNPWITVIGVVADVRHRGLDTAPRPEWYLCHAQADQAMGIGPRRSFAIALRTTRPPERLFPEVRSVIAELDPDLPVARIRTMDEIRSQSLARQRFTTFLLASFALLAVVLGSIGIFGVISQGVVCRSREIGVRMALGARRGQVVRMVLAEGLSLAAIGMVLGGCAALGFSRVLRSQLHEVSPTDPWTFGATLMLVVGVAIVASLIPAARAAGLDPWRVLREE
jgi:predicted permease